MYRFEQHGLPGGEPETKNRSGEGAVLGWLRKVLDRPTRHRITQNQDQQHSETGLSRTNSVCGYLGHELRITGMSSKVKNLLLGRAKALV
jgi:hypothetical protein